jgi:DNA mismatch repair ATPase MutS
MLIRMEREVEKESERKEADEKGVKKVEVKKEYVVQEHPLIEELKAINLEKISPIEALNRLYEIKKMIK